MLIDVYCYKRESRLKERLEREKQELRAYIEKDNKAMKAKLSEEEEARKRKEAEMNEAMKEQEAHRENEIIQLYKKMADENVKRQDEIRTVDGKLQAETESREALERKEAELAARVEANKTELKAAQEKGDETLKGNIDENSYEANGRINDLAAKLAALTKDSNNGLKTLQSQMEAEKAEIRTRMSLPLSIYFNAFRSEDYVSGGEEYLTFDGCHSNCGNGMDPKSGVFTAPIAGSYLFLIHVCTHDMKKALMTLRRNGREVASFYDQNHESNHKNSMAGQSVLLDLQLGDKMQVYIFTDTGLQDKPNNHLTQFVGLLLRPKNFLSDDFDVNINGH